MALSDLDGDGNRNDMVDNFTEHQIYKKCTSNNINSTPRSSASSSSVGGFWIVFIIAAIVGAFNEILGALILLGYGWLKLMGM